MTLVPDKDRLTDPEPLHKRRAEHARSEELEKFLRELNQFLESVGPARPTGQEMHHRPIFVVGCARSGTTMVVQDLSENLGIRTPSNLMSRFYGDPWVGAMAHKVLLELDVTEELFIGGGQNANSRSRLGKTIGPASPHEYWYWWRRFFSFVEHHGEQQDLKEQVALRFRAELASMINVFNAPMVFKAMIMNWNIPQLAAIVPEAIFLCMEREVSDNACSLLNARTTVYGNTSVWWSFKPPNISELITFDPLEQVFAQVKCTNDAIATGLSKVPDQQVIRWDYDQYCADPGRHLEQVARLLNMEHKEVGASGSPKTVLEKEWPAGTDMDKVHEFKVKYGA